MSAHTNKHYAKLRLMSVTPRSTTTVRVDLKYLAPPAGAQPPQAAEWWGQESYVVGEGSLAEFPQVPLAFPVDVDPIQRLGYYLNFNGEPNLPTGPSPENPKFLPVPAGILVQDIEVMLTNTNVSMTAFTLDGSVVAGQQWELQPPPGEG